MYVTNMAYFGHLKSSENYRTDRKHNDMYELYNNRLVSRFFLIFCYLSKNYSSFFFVKLYNNSREVKVSLK